MASLGLKENPYVYLISLFASFNITFILLLEKNILKVTMFFSFFKGLPGVDGREGIPGMPGAKVRHNWHISELW